MNSVVQFGINGAVTELSEEYNMSEQEDLFGRTT